MKNIGVDIVNNERFKDIIDDEVKFSRILSNEEKEVYLTFTSPKRKLEYLASRFAAKEAIIKAINKTNLSYGYRDISILNEENGAPYVKFSFTVDFNVLISISHSEDNSIAFAVMM